MKSNKKLITLLLSFLVIAVFAVGGTVAFIYTSSQSVNNVFQPSQVTTKVVEEINGEVKENVKIQNTGNTDAWIRAYVVITWQDAQGNVYGQMPKENEHYSINMNVDEKKDSNSQWYLGEDGFYYWPQPVKSLEEDPINYMTGNLINSISPIERVNTTIPTSYHLTVEIIGSGIQSVPDTVFNTVWASSGLKVSENGKTLEIAKTGGT